VRSSWCWPLSDPGPIARPCRHAPLDVGQGLVEYGLILVLAIVICVVSLVFFSDQLSTLLSLIASAV